MKKFAGLSKKSNNTHARKILALGLSPLSGDCAAQYRALVSGVGGRRVLLGRAHRHQQRLQHRTLRQSVPSVLRGRTRPGRLFEAFKWRFNIVKKMDALFFYIIDNLHLYATN